MLTVVEKANEERERPNGSPHDDEALMLLCAAGRSVAFAELVRRHQHNVLRYLARMVGESDALDLCQETFLELWRTRQRYRPQGRFTVLLYRIARNKALSRLRWRRVRTLFALQTRLSDVAGPEGVPAPGRVDALGALLEQERATLLNLVLAGLPSSLREAVVLHYAAELDYQQMAAITGAPAGTLRSRAHRGLVLLRQRLSRREEA